MVRAPAPTAVLAILVVLSMSLAVDAADGRLYRWKDKSGVVHYSDTPPPEDASQPAPPAGQERAPRPQGVPAGDAKTERLRLAMIDEVLTVSGVKREVEQMPAGLKMGFELASGPAGKTEQGAALLRVLTNAFRAETFYAALRRSFRTYLDDEQLGATLTFYRSPTGRKLARLTAEVGPKTPEDMKAFAERLKSDPAAQARLPLIQRLEAATGSAELGLDAAGAMFTTGALAITQALPPERRPSPAQVERMASEFKMRGSEGIRQATWLRLLYVYRSVPDTEFLEYVQFAETETGRWFSTALRGSLLDTITAVADKLQPEIARTLAPAAGTAPPARR